MKSCQRFFTFAIVMLAAQLPAQTLNVLYAFTNTPDGANPRSGVIWNSNLLYGTTYSGGTNSDGLSYTNLKIFIGSPADGRNPNRGLLLVSNTFYGTTYYGGSNGYGVVFKM